MFGKISLFFFFFPDSRIVLRKGEQLVGNQCRNNVEDNSKFGIMFEFTVSISLYLYFTKRDYRKEFTYKEL